MGRHRPSIPEALVDWAAVTQAARSTAREWLLLRARQEEAARRAYEIAGIPNPDAPPPPKQPSKRSQKKAAQRERAEQSAAAAQRDAWQVADGDLTEPSEDSRHFDQPASEAGTEFSVLRRFGVHGPTNLYPGVPERKPAGRPRPSRQPPKFDDVPPGIDINVFRTAQGSKILGSLGQEKRKPPPKREVRYPAPWADVKSSANPGNISSAEATPPKEPAAVQSKGEPEAAAPQPADDVAQPNPLQGRAYELRESKVPATRVGRLWNYGGLAAGMLGGALTESLTRAVGGGGSSQGSVMLSPANMERLVSRLSRMRGAALKMGQMMSFQDAKMLPGPIHEVLQRVQDRADYMPSYQRDKVLVANLGANWRDLFEEFEEKPIAAASIGQVHKAKLKSNGQPVAVKIQFPGVADSINSDLDNLGVLLTATKLLPKGLYLDKTIANARTELAWECDYEREAECLTRFKALMADEEDVFRVPAVYAEASGKHVLTMDFMRGQAVTRIATFSQQQRDWIGTQILRLCLREITEFRFMQTDPNWTNFLYNAESNRLELLDFGASREYPESFVRLYVKLLEAASRSDKGAVKELSEELGYLTGLESKTMLDAHVGSVLTLAEPFLSSAPEVYDFHDQTITERVKGFIPIMLKERLTPPPEETYSLHRKLSGAFLLCARLGSRVRCRELFQESLKKAGFSVQT
ncbi:hypothetical protein VUR80DRAFT_3447 [Thermomyces stellatus]